MKCIIKILGLFLNVSREDAEFYTHTQQQKPTQTNKHVTPNKLYYSNHVCVKKLYQRNTGQNITLQHLLLSDVITIKTLKKMLCDVTQKQIIIGY